jgi:hypothetical protein
MLVSGQSSSGVEDSVIVSGVYAESFILPPRAVWFQGDVAALPDIKDVLFDVILMDPPWDSKSVARAKAYSTMPVSACTALLQSLNTTALLHPGGIGKLIHVNVIYAHYFMV